MMKIPLSTSELAGIAALLADGYVLVHEEEKSNG